MILLSIFKSIFYAVLGKFPPEKSPPPGNMYIHVCPPLWTKDFDISRAAYNVLMKLWQYQ